MSIFISYVVHFFLFCSFFFNDTATTEIYTLSLHDALPISSISNAAGMVSIRTVARIVPRGMPRRSEEHTSELSHRCISYAVFCLKKKKNKVRRLRCIKKKNKRKKKIQQEN